jgi:hypothetical protein
MCLVCYSVVLLSRETGPLQLLAPLLLMGGKGADLVIRGDIVLNTLSTCSTSTLLRDQICITSLSSRQVLGLAELSYTTDFDSPFAQSYGMLKLDLLFLMCARTMIHMSNLSLSSRCYARARALSGAALRARVGSRVYAPGQTGCARSHLLHASPEPLHASTWSGRLRLQLHVGLQHVLVGTADGRSSGSACFTGHSSVKFQLLYYLLPE